MKIRQGFVSNSSSSSFVVITSRLNHENTMTHLHPFIHAVIAAIGPQAVKFLGHDCIIFNVMTGNYSTFEDLDIDYQGDIPDELGGDGQLAARREAWDAYLEAIKEHGDVVVNQTSC